MASPGNPFASTAGGLPGGGGNPFDPFANAPAAPAPSPAYGAYPGYAAGPAAPQQGGYGGPPMQQQQQQQPSQQQFAGMQQPNAQVPAPAPVMDPWQQQQQQPPMQQQQQQQPPMPQQQQSQMQAYQQPPSAPASYDPFGAAPAAANQLVVSQQQSNPYGGIVQTQAPAAYGSQPQQQQWGMPQAPTPAPYGAAPAQAPPAAGGYDPFAPPPVQAPAPPPAPVAPAPPPTADLDNPFGDAFPAPPSYTPAAPAPPPAYPPHETSNQMVVAQQQPMHQYQSSGPYDHYQNQPGGGAIVPHEPDSRAIVPADNSEVRNKYAGELAREAPPNASPLPKADLVKKRGYVLSRISFRTIVMKKWKQSYWVQYGSHTMLWFRSQGDFDDWLNNPYHTQAQRNFLIKLAVNFVHDLYKPNVRGYQVTQCRVKPYGNKMVRQFKLERWMDYGPTIAAAFGSFDPAEVDALREALVECMRNTPLDGGIRATGAVRQMPDSHNQGEPINRDYHQNSGGPSQHHNGGYDNNHDDDDGDAMNQRFHSSGKHLYWWCLDFMSVGLVY